MICGIIDNINASPSSLRHPVNADGNTNRETRLMCQLQKFTKMDLILIFQSLDYRLRSLTRFVGTTIVRLQKLLGNYQPSQSSRFG